MTPYKVNEFKLKTIKNKMGPKILIKSIYKEKFKNEELCGYNIELKYNKKEHFMRMTMVEGKDAVEDIVETIGKQIGYIDHLNRTSYGQDQEKYIEQMVNKKFSELGSWLLFEVDVDTKIFKNNYKKCISSFVKRNNYKLLEICEDLCLNFEPVFLSLFEREIEKKRFRA